MSLYRKYRPATLAALVGQNHIQQTFAHALQKGALSHAYLFAGPRGTGKTSTARIIARAINCENPAADGEPCNACPVCTAALAGQLTDLIEIDAASNRGIDEMRDLKEKIAFSPSRARAKVYIIDEVHMLTKEAFNALLKTLEEPPAHAYFILATTETHKVPETILSRCQRFDFHRVATADIAGHLAEVAAKEGIHGTPAAYELLAEQAAGGMRDALSLLDQFASEPELTVEIIAASLGLTRPVAVAEFVAAVASGQTAAALATVEQLVTDGVNLVEFNRAVVAALRREMLLAANANNAAGTQKFVRLIEIFLAAGQGLKNALIAQLPLELAVVEASDELKIPSSELREVSRKETAVATAIAPVKPPSNPPLVKVAEGFETPSVSATVASTPVTKVVANVANSELDLPAARAALASVVAQMKPSRRSSLQQVDVLAAVSGVLTLGVPNQFLCDKLNTAEAKSELGGLLSEALGRLVSVKMEVAEVQLTARVAAPAVTKTAVEVAIPIPTKKSAEAPQPVDIAAAAEQMFADDDTF